MKTQDYLDKLGIIPSECACDLCVSMCTAPCCGSVEDIEKIIDAGYAHRIMFDNLPTCRGSDEILKPALKGYEGKRAPWAVKSRKGCTFWDENGRCELHNKNLKPVLGRVAIHGYPIDYHEQFGEISKEDWESERGKELISKWKKIVGYVEEDEK